MYIIAGLGNPGRKYEGTRHNVGFHAIFYLEDRLGVNANRVKFQAATGEAQIAGHRVLLLKPQTYMNLSGNAIREAMNFYKVPPEKLIVIYDDWDIPVGRLRVRPSGSAGSHNGMRSILQQIGTEGFPRVRIGIGEETRAETVHYVLSRFPKEQEKMINDIIKQAGDAAIDIIENGVDHAMNTFNPK